ncbi:Fic family protein [Helicobacter cetorum]|uniref:Putative cell division protein n=1 Tax=Helicobacter cetorum (strain ATCC BAA-540 / CCUG 52418 / MIT 99-5656) TaxID=1163745 RepID=I0ETP4_HELCM|nr:Fic family protein [Helicobacter cetorum]AFI06313.1 putative cell division protein [Helicobacter cetorum MIT 99-5656]
MQYNPNALNNLQILNAKEKKELNSLICHFDEFKNAKGLFEKLGFDFIYSSAQIEGNTYNKLDTLCLLEEGLTAGGKKYGDAKMILNLKKAFDFILNNDLKLNLETCLEIHSILSEELVLKSNQGIMRKHNLSGISGTSYLPLSTGDKLHTEMKFVFTQIDKIENPFEQAIFLHNNLCYLQYFEDCNKRTARCMQFIALKNHNIMPLVILEDNKDCYKQYRGAMIEYYETNNYAPYIEFFKENYAKMQNFLQEVRELSLQQKQAHSNSYDNADDLDNSNEYAHTPKRRR